MTRIELAPEVFDDFDRFFEHIAQFDPGAAPQRIGEILDAIQILTHSPLIGRPVKAPMARSNCSTDGHPNCSRQDALNYALVTGVMAMRAAASLSL